MKMDAVFDLPSPLNKLNKWIADGYGRDITGQPRFRLIWTSNEYEKRYGEFTDWHGSILIRQINEVRLCKKYPWIPHRWALEKLTPVGYEMFYPFEDGDRNPLPVIYPALELILHFVTTGSIKQALFDSEARFKKEQETESAEIAEKIANEAPLLSNEGGISMRGSK